MERLTNKREADAQREEYERRLANGYPRNIPEERFLRLAAYEDTGLEPEEIDGIKSLAVLGLMRDVKRASAIMDAEREGRLLVLPCKVGDAVYLPTKNDWGDLLSFEVIEIGVDRDGPFFVIDDEEHDHIPMSDIGADVFLSREKAEEALAKEAT